jgi:hypothetical protein
VYAGFGGLATKLSEEGFSVWASKPSPRAWRDGDGIRVLQALSNTEGIPVLGPDAFIRNNSCVPIPPARDWGQGPVLEGVLPQGWLS